MEQRFEVTAEIMDQFKSYHSRHGAWGKFHVVLDDFNLKCLPAPDDTWTDEERSLLIMLTNMTPTQRGKIAKKC